MSRPTSSWATVPSKFTREESREWKQWLDDPKGVDINKGRFTCSGPTSFGALPTDIDELYERMKARGIVVDE